LTENSQARETNTMGRMVSWFQRHIPTRRGVISLGIMATREKKGAFK